MGAGIGSHTALIRYMIKHESEDNDLDMESATEEQVAKGRSDAVETYAATAFLSGLNRKKYPRLLDYLANSYLSGHNDYQKSVAEVYKRVMG